MIRHRLLAAIVLSSASLRSNAQSPCPTSTLQGSSAKISSALICAVPQIYGAGGMVGADNSGPLNTTTGHEVHFQASALNSFGPVNSQIGVELSQLPIAAPVAGIVFSGGILTAVESYGPILTDRAESLGRHVTFVGVTYQHFEFDRVDGSDLNNLGIVLTHEAEPTVCTSGSLVPCVNGEPIYTNDIIATRTGIDLKVHQIAFVASFGFTDKLDVSVAIPVSDVRMGVRSLATIFNFEPPPVNHQFSTVSTNPGETYLDSYNARFTKVNNALGIGDITLRAKYKMWQSSDEHSAVAAGLDARLPSGDSYNFLGSGTWGIRPFITYSRSGGISPHATVGFQGNGSSVLAGTITSQPITNAKLPDIFSYAAGTDVSLGQNASASVDFLGQTLLSASKIGQSTFTDYVGGTHANITSTTSSVTELSLSAGGKVKLYRHLLFSANVLLRVNDGGLHSKPVPLAGLSYSF